jgi:hypothetical protein
VTPAGAHPAAHELAELVAGAMEGERAARVESHARDCPACQDVLARLGQVSSALHELPAELSVPEHVSARIVAAVGAEHVSAEASLTAVDDGRSGGEVAWFRRRAPQALAAAASVAVVALAGYVAVSGDGTDQPTAADSRAGESASDEAAADGDTPDTVGTMDVPRQPRSGEVDREELTDAVTEVWEQRSEFAPGCGAQLGDELGQGIVGSTAVGAGVLVVLEDTDDAQLDGWLLPTCDSASADALTAPVVIPRPS